MLWIRWEEAWSGGVSSTLSPGVVVVVVVIVIAMMMVIMMMRARWLSKHQRRIRQ